MDTLDKERLSKLLMQIDRLYNTKGNDEFKAGIVTIANSDKVGHDAIFDEIYEYCLEKNSRAQAAGFYSGFPFAEIKRELEIDFHLMESFKRRGYFELYGVQMFKQIERISNFVLSDKDYQSIISKLLPTSALVNFNQTIRIHDRKVARFQTVSKLVFNGYEDVKNKDGSKTPKKDLPFEKWNIFDKVRATLYFAGYATKMFSDTEYRHFCEELYDIYLIRNHAAHGVIDSDLPRIQKYLDSPNMYYASFFDTFYFFVNKIIKGYKEKKELLDYANNPQEICKDGSVYNVFPEELFVFIIGEGSVLAPKQSYSQTRSFSKGEDLTIVVKSGIIQRIEHKTK